MQISWERSASICDCNSQVTMRRHRVLEVFASLATWHWLLLWPSNEVWRARATRTDVGKLVSRKKNGTGFSVLL